MNLSTGNIIRASETSAESGKSHSAGAVIRAGDATVNVTSGKTLIKPEHFARQEIYFIQNGYLSPGIENTFVENGTTCYVNEHVNEYRDNLNTYRDSNVYCISTYTGGGEGHISYYFIPKVNITNSYKKIILDASGIGDTSYIGLSTQIKNPETVDFVQSFVYVYRTEDWFDRQTFTFDISSITSGEYYLALKIARWGETRLDETGNYVYVGAPGVLLIHNLYLST